MNEEEIYIQIAQLQKKIDKLPLGSIRRANLEWQIKQLVNQLHPPSNSAEGFK